MNVRTTVVHLFCLLLCICTPDCIASAQSVSAETTFDLLKAAHAADSLRLVSSRQQAALAKALKANAAKSDTIARQRRELAAIGAARPAQDSASVARVAPVAQMAPVVPVAEPPRSPNPAPAAVTKPAHEDTVSARIVTPVSSSSAAPHDTTPPRPAPATPAVQTRAAAPSAPVISGMLQLWLVGGDAGYRNTYRLRRAEVRASGTAAPKIAWSVMLDLGKSLSATTTTTSSGAMQTTIAQSGRALQDAVVMLQLHPRARLDVGQQKIPFGIEGFQSSSTLPTVERALFASDRARGGSFGDMRDVGASLRGRLGATLDYNLGVFNGSGESQNDVDANLAKSVAGHLAFHPIPLLLIGASGVGAGRGADDAPVRDRLGAELRVQTSRVLVQTEAVTGHDGALAREGMYVHAGYRVRAPLDVHVRFDAWDPDHSREADAASATERDYLAGITWNVAGTSVKAQADALRRTYSASLIPARTQLLLNLQTTW